MGCKLYESQSKKVWKALFYAMKSCRAGVVSYTAQTEGITELEAAFDSDPYRSFVPSRAPALPLSVRESSLEKLRDFSKIRLILIISFTMPGLIKRTSGTMNAFVNGYRL